MLTQEEYDIFKEKGYLDLGKLLSDAEVARFAGLFDRDRSRFGRFWKSNVIWQSSHCHQLLTAPEFDEIIRHPTVLEYLQLLFGGEVCFSGHP